MKKKSSKPPNRSRPRTSATKNSPRRGTKKQTMLKYVASFLSPKDVETLRWRIDQKPPNVRITLRLSLDLEEAFQWIPTLPKRVRENFIAGVRFW